MIGDTKIYCSNGGDKVHYKLFSVDGKEQYLIHRDSGPAIEYESYHTGNRSYYKQGQLHRENGPAIDDANGHKAWFLNGWKYTKEEFDKQMKSV